MGQVVDAAERAQRAFTRTHTQAHALTALVVTMCAGATLGPSIFCCHILFRPPEKYFLRDEGVVF